MFEILSKFHLLFKIKLTFTKKRITRKIIIIEFLSIFYIPKDFLSI